MSNTLFSLVNKDGKYVVLPSGELQIRNVNKEDGEKTYQCRTKHRLTGETKLSATAGKLVITGKTYFLLRFFATIKLKMQNYTNAEYAK